MVREQIVLGFDVGGTKLGIGLGSSEGKILGKARIENVDTYPEDILPQMVSEAKRLVAEAKLTMGDIAAFGISAPFPADPVNGIMTAPVNNRHWRNVPILQYMRDNLKLDGCFENDANCGALAEWFFGAGRACKDIIYLTMSTGIGGGIIAAGHLIRGGRALSAGEVGHICVEINGRQCSCGQKGCYEAYSGGRALALRIQAELKDKPDSMIMQLVDGKADAIDMVVLEKAVRANDPYSVALWDEMSLRNAQAFGMLINTFNPEKLILGTLAWAVGDLYTDPIKKYLPQFCWKEPREACEIVSSELRRDIGYYAGAAAALNFLKERGEASH
ncbi:MAG: ROK family protein [Victivallales bacterium]|jgi:glucokinase|nr:ROK family protein [Victivallales bacterium]